MFAQAARLVAGSAQMLRAFASEPGLATELPRWIADAKVRKEPLTYRQPWWNYRAIAYVEARLSAGDRVFEYGGGASSLWLLDRGVQLTTIEDNEQWLRGLHTILPQADVRFMPTPNGASLRRRNSTPTSTRATGVSSSPSSDPVTS